MNLSLSKRSHSDEPITDSGSLGNINIINSKKDKGGKSTKKVKKSQSKNNIS